MPPPRWNARHGRAAQTHFSRSPSRCASSPRRWRASSRRRDRPSDIDLVHQYTRQRGIMSVRTTAGCLVFCCLLSVTAYAQEPAPAPAPAPVTEPPKDAPEPKKAEEPKPEKAEIHVTETPHPT